MEKRLSLKTQNIIRSIVGGTFWFLAGVFSQWDSKPCQIIYCIAMLGAVASMYFVLFARIEKDDEMSKLHFFKAKAKAYDLTILAIMVLCLVIMSFKMFAHKVLNINFQAWIFMIVGFMQFVSGLFFARYERNGD